MDGIPPEREIVEDIRKLLKEIRMKTTLPKLDAPRTGLKGETKERRPIEKDKAEHSKGKEDQESRKANNGEYHDR